MEKIRSQLSGMTQIGSNAALYKYSIPTYITTYWSMNTRLESCWYCY